MKQNTPPSNTDTVLPTAQWQQYADNASRFAAECVHEMDEKGEAHSFWDEFLQIFNIRRRQFARHEARAKRSDNRRGFVDLYDSLKMPAELLAAHQHLDLAVDACYGIKKGFQSEAGRVGWLFGRWGEVVRKLGDKN
jgi:hypothetical protein